jgi:peptide/nickel transport system substrate-binding protein
MKKNAALLLVIALMASACSSPQPGGTPARGTATGGNWATVRLEADPGVLNPLTTTSAYANYILLGALGSMICEQLLQYDPQTGTPTVPGLATAYPEVSPDHRVYTFTIREGVKWHDGRPFSVEDLLFTVKAAMVPSVDDAAFKSYFSSLGGVEIVGRNQIRFRMTDPYWLNDAALATSIVPLAKHVYDPEGVLDRYRFEDIRDAKAANDPLLKSFGEAFNKNSANRAPIGTGPYKLAKWQTGEELVLVRNEDYWGRKPHLDKVVYKIISDPTTALAALKSGEIDFVPRLLPIQFQEQTSAPAFQERFVKVPYQIPQLAYIGWNEARPFFRDKRVRQALTMLIDRPKVIEAVRRGMGAMAASPFAPGSPDFDPDIKPWPYDSKRAAELLDEAGWIDHNGNGIRDKDGVEFKFEILASTSNPAAVQLLGILENELGKTGISITGRQLDPPVFVSTLRDQKVDAAIGSWTTALLFDPYQLFHSDSAKNRGSNYYNFRNPEADRVMQQARIEFDPEKRKQLYWRFQEIFHDQQPYTLLYYPEEAAAYHSRFQNVQFTRQRPGYDFTKWSVGPVQRVAAAN